MKLPLDVGPDETATESQIETWLRRMSRWGLLEKTYRVSYRVGDWEYENTLLGDLVFRLLNLLLKLRILRPPR